MNHPSNQCCDMPHTIMELWKCACHCHQPKEVELKDGSCLVEESDKGELPWRKNLRELVERFPTQLENALDSAWLQGSEDRKEPHLTMDNYCCACEADKAFMNEKIAEARGKVLAEVEKKLKKIAMVDNGKEPKYFVKDVLEVLDEVKSI